VLPYLLQKVQRGNMFTHHQKTVIVDTELTPGHSPPPMMNEAVPTRRIQAFVGGLDLTNGRYDYASHPLFDSCAPGGPHCIDMYQGCVEGEAADWSASWLPGQRKSHALRQSLLAG
jgi:hypothetical protein